MVINKNLDDFKWIGGSKGIKTLLKKTEWARNLTMTTDENLRKMDESDYKYLINKLFSP